MCEKLTTVLITEGSNTWMNDQHFSHSLAVCSLWHAAAAAAAESLQSCPTLYDPIDGSPPGSPVRGIL